MSNIFLQSSATFEEHRMKYFLGIISDTTGDPTAGIEFKFDPFQSIEEIKLKKSKGCTIS